MSPERKTKAEQGKSNDVLTRKTRKISSAKIAEEENVSTVNEEIGEGDENPEFQEDLAGETQETSRRKPRSKGKAGKAAKRASGKRKRKVKADPLDDIAARYQAELKSIFDYYNTDRKFDGFDVDCDVFLCDTPGVLIIQADLIKEDMRVMRIERPILSFPNDIHMVALDLYASMESWGFGYAEHIGV